MPDESEALTTPTSVKSEIQRTRSYIESLTREVFTGLTQKGEAALTASDRAFMLQYIEWRRQFTEWADENSGDWTTQQLVSMSQIAARNLEWRREGQQQQATFRQLGFQTVTLPPGSGSTTPPGTGQPGGFPAGVKSTVGLFILGLLLKRVLGW